jgi:hypothetical protein
MKASTILAILAPIAAVNASCYKKGDSWDSKLDAANKAIDEFCGNGALSGGFGQGQTKYSCRQLEDGNKKAQFWVAYNGGGSGSLSADECKFRLKNEAGACQHGGESTIGSWYYRYVWSLCRRGWELC